MSMIPTPEQTLLLWSLLGAGGQGKLSAGKDREALIGAGLVAAGWRAGSKTPLFEVTDHGWAWAGDHLGDALPAKGKLLQAWLGRLKAYLDASGTPLAELFMPAPEPLSPQPVKAPPKAKAPPKPKAPPEPKAPAKPRKPATPKQVRAPKTAGAATPKARTRSRVSTQRISGTIDAASPPKTPGPQRFRTLRSRVAKAYVEVTGKKTGARAMLLDLRAKLADIERPLLDAALTQIVETDTKMLLMTLDDPREITPAIAAAALIFKGTTLHFLRMSR